MSDEPSEWVIQDTMTRLNVSRPEAIRKINQMHSVIERFREGTTNEQ